MPTRLLQLAALCAAAAMTLHANAQGKDELWEMTMKMEMEGMPMAMPAQTSKVCMEAGKSEAAVPKGDSDCRMSSVKHSGDKTSFRMECTQPEKMAGSGEITRTKDRLSGTISLKGDDMSMKQTFSGRLVGSCDAKSYTRQQIAQYEKPMQEQRARSCKEAVDDLDPRIFMASPNEASMSAEQRAALRKMAGCDDYKKKFCARASEVGGSMRTPKGYAAAYERYRRLDDALRFCGQDPKKIEAAACKSGASERDWNFVGKRCPVEANAVAVKYCIGRDYTEVMAKAPEELRGICSRYAEQRDRAALAQPPADKATCQARLRDRDWRFLTVRCPDEARTVAAEKCVGRDYTEVMSNVDGEFRGLCARHAPQRGMATAPAAPRSAPAENKSEESTTESAIKEGTNVLRKFLKF